MCSTMYLTRALAMLYLLLLVSVTATPVKRYEPSVTYPLGQSGEASNTVTIIKLEDGCVRQGGICVEKNACPPDDRVFGGSNLSNMLCPLQAHMGVICCYL